MNFKIISLQFSQPSRNYHLVSGSRNAFLRSDSKVMLSMTVTNETNASRTVTVASVEVTAPSEHWPRPLCWLCSAFENTWNDPQVGLTWRRLTPLNLKG